MLRQFEVQNIYIGEYKQTGIYHNSTLGLISLSSDGTNRITIADKNIGATDVQTSTPSSVTTNGYIYQWGNNYGFPNQTPSTTSSSQTNAGSYGPGNYYSSSTFRNVGNATRDSSYNANLWGNTTNTNVARRGPCAEGYHVPSVDDLTGLVDILQGLGLLPSSSGTGTITTDMRDNITNSLKIYGNNRIAGNGTYVSSNSPIVFVSSTLLSTNVSSYGLTIGTTYWYHPSDTSDYGLFTSAGYPIRPFKNDAVQPDSSRTKLY